MNILSLHKMGNPKNYREAIRSLEFMFSGLSDDINCAIHDVDLPFPEYLKEIPFDLIVLGPTFLCARYHDDYFQKLINEYSFIKNYEGCKVALPQDDYDCAHILDDWMIDWNIDLIYSVCTDHWNVLYPKNYNKNRIRLGYTSYISQQWLDSWKSPFGHNDRKIDVSYRATKLPANFGFIGQLKWQIADRFKNLIKSEKDLVIDVSVNPDDIIPGLKWHSFIENSKFCLATPSGSSVLDSRNEIRRKINVYSRNNPVANFFDIKSNCFPNEDGLFVFTALSPRNIEAGLAETVQIGAFDSSPNLLRKDEHYIPLKDDCSNKSEVLEKMKDISFVNRIKKNFKSYLLDNRRLRKEVFANEIIEYALNLSAKRGVSDNNPNKTKRIIRMFNYYSVKNSQKHWSPSWLDNNKKRLKSLVHNLFNRNFR